MALEAGALLLDQSRVSVGVSALRGNNDSRHEKDGERLIFAPHLSVMTLQYRQRYVPPKNLKRRRGDYVRRGVERRIAWGIGQPK